MGVLFSMLSGLIGMKISTKTNITIDEVLKEKHWIIFEINGKKKIYDISQWIEHHPGGKVILEGVKANKYYKDKSGKKPSILFKNIHNGNIKAYIQKHNDYIKEIGVLNK